MFQRFIGCIKSADFDTLFVQGVPKKVLTDCCWSHGALVQPWAWKMFVCSFLAKTKQDRVLPRHSDGEIWPHSAQFWS